MQIENIYDIDFTELYRKHKKQAGRAKSMAQKWDQKAAQIAIGGLETPYSLAFLKMMDLRSTDSLLDVGCGTGAIAVLAAAKTAQVYALDYSQGMLDKLLLNAEHYDTHNIKTLCKDWDESWADVPQCDVVVASRSTLVEDMEDALMKLEAHAKRHVYLTYPATIDFGALPGINTSLTPELGTPSYLYIVAILHQLGRRAQLRFINNTSGLGGTKLADWAMIDWEV